MAFHIKSTTKFKALIGFSALAVSGIAALFSITGVSSLFKGAWLATVLMMGILEFAKIVVASYIARYWTNISKTLRTYFIIAVMVLMAITSAGIFGYLSEAYQGTKGNYDVTEQESVVLVSKKTNYEEQIQRYKDRVNTLNSFRASQEVRLDSLYSRGMTTSAKRVEQGIQRNDIEVQSLNDKISALTDSVGSISNQVVTKQSVNIKGELGPLKFIADAFGTSMDTVVKYLILMLIFVFDPLAVLLFVSLSIMIRKEAEAENVETKPIENNTDESPEERELSEVVASITNNIPPTVTVKEEPNTVISNEIPIPIITTDILPIQEVPIAESTDEKKTLNELAKELAEDAVQQSIDKIEESKVEVKNEHEFYYGDVVEEPPVPTPPPSTPSSPPVPDWHTANWRGH